MAAAPVLVSRLADHLEFLTSDACAGRAPGSPGGLKARQYLMHQLGAGGVVPHHESGFASPVDGLDGAANVIGKIPGSSPERAVLIAAHYDHLGTMWNDVYRGADDNASGVAVVLEAARLLAQRSDELARTVIVCGFDAEEPPNFLAPTMGSIHFVDSHPDLVDSIDLMINLDLIGHRLGPEVLAADLQQGIFVMGSETGTGIADLIGSVSVEGLVPWRLSRDTFATLSDHHAFAAAGVPWLFFTSGRDRRYHTPDDTAEHVDIGRLGALTEYLVDLVIAASNMTGPTRPDSVEPDHLSTLDRLAVLGRAVPGHDVRTLSLIEGLRQRIEERGHLEDHELGSLQLAYLKVEEMLR